MRIGLTGIGGDVDKVVAHAQRAEADGFSALWYAGAVGGDPVVSMAFAGRATERIELGTSVLQTYPIHPVLQANRIAAAAAAMGRPGFTLGVGPSHEVVIRGMYGVDYSRAGRHTEEHVSMLAALLAGEPVDVTGEDLTLRGGAAVGQPSPHPVGLLVAALGPRLLRVAGERTDGTILWMANARAVETHVAPLLRAAASAAGRPEPRIVTGLPVAVHDDVDEARETAARSFAVYGTLPNYQRILAHGGISSPAEAAVVGSEDAVAAQLTALVDAGTTDIWAAPFPVGDDTSASRARTRALLKDLASA